MWGGKGVVLSHSFLNHLDVHMTHVYKEIGLNQNIAKYLKVFHLMDYVCHIFFQNICQKVIVNLVLTLWQSDS